ncbi:MAG: hypothetical protein MRZ66_05780 [Clostridiales bacterium]|nr:hypothetical protein [Clostridiales bacterium]
MKLKDKDQVKKWLRNLTLIKREMRLKIDFYNTLIDDFTRLSVSDERLRELKPEFNTYLTAASNIEFYRSEIDKCRNKYNNILNDWNRLSELLDSDEVMVVTAKYLKGITWDAMEFSVFFSRRQCFRIMDRAVEKLVGQTVGEW